MGDAVSGLGDPGDDRGRGGRGGRDDGARSPDALTQAMRGGVALSNGHLREVLRAVAEMDRTQGWKADGATSMSNWLVRAEALNWSTAKDYVEVGHHLEELPAVAATFAEGLLSFDQVRALCRFVTPEDDDDWAERARGMTVDELHRHARVLEPVAAADDAELWAQRSVTFRASPRERMAYVTARLPCDAAADVVESVERRVQAMPAPAEGEHAEPGRARMADALLDIVRADLAGTSDARKSTVTVHATETAIGDADPQASTPGSVWIEGGPPVSAELARRLGCDGYIQRAVDTPDGRSYLDGPRSRVIPPSVERRVRMRDNATCRWPGCDRTIYLQIHHVLHWAHGGTHTPNNLICLCTHHHHRLHEDGFQIRGNPDAKVTFHRPDGTRIRAGPGPGR